MLFLFVIHLFIKVVLLNENCQFPVTRLKAITSEFCYKIRLMFCESCAFRPFIFPRCISRVLR